MRKTWIKFWEACRHNGLFVSFPRGSMSAGKEEMEVCNKAKLTLYTVTNTVNTYSRGHEIQRLVTHLGTGRASALHGSVKDSGVWSGSWVTVNRISSLGGCVSNRGGMVTVWANLRVRTRLIYRHYFIVIIIHKQNLGFKFTVLGLRLTLYWQRSRLQQLRTILCQDAVSWLLWTHFPKFRWMYLWVCLYIPAHQQWSHCYTVSLIHDPNLAKHNLTTVTLNTFKATSPLLPPPLPLIQWTAWIRKGLEHRISLSFTNFSPAHFGLEISGLRSRSSMNTKQVLSVSQHIYITTCKRHYNHHIPSPSPHHQTSSPTPASP